MAVAINQKTAVLFVGAGATASSGGATWPELSAHIAKLFGKPISADPQEVFDDLCDIEHRRPEVYTAVQNRLRDATTSPGLEAILRLPWLGIYTTNYDVAIESFYRGQTTTNPRVYVTAESGVQFGIPGEIPVFKIMGSLNKGPEERGQMALSTDDIGAKQADEIRLFAHLDGLVAAQAILAVGYSFRDKVLMNAISRIRHLSSQRSTPIYGLFREPVDEEWKRRLTAKGVHVVPGDLAEFGPGLAAVTSSVVDAPGSALLYGGSRILLKPHSIRDAFAAFDLVSDEELSRPPTLDDFLRGETGRAGAYERSYQWIRGASKGARVAVGAWVGSSNDRSCIVTFHGRPGSGRTVAANDLLHHVAATRKCIAIRLPPRKLYPDATAAAQLLGQVIQAVPASDRPFLAALFEERVEPPNVAQFIDEVMDRTHAPRGVLVIRTSSEPFPEGYDESLYNTLNYELEDRLPETEVPSLVSYVGGLPIGIRARGWTDGDIKAAAAAEPSFLELMYRLVDPTKRSISLIVRTEFANLDAEGRNLVRCIVVSHLAGTPIPITLLAKMLGTDIFSTFQLLARCRTLVKVEDIVPRTPEISFFHSRVGEIISAIPELTQTWIRSIDAAIDLANLDNGSEHQFLVSLLIEKRERRAAIDAYLQPREVLERFERLVSSGATAVFQHHYGIRLTKEQDFDRAIRVLKTAHETCLSEEQRTERPEIVLTSLANTKWLSLKASKPERLQEDPRTNEVLLLLSQAEDSKWNPHAFDVHSRILADIGGQLEGDARARYLGEAIGVLREGLDLLGTPDPVLSQRIQEISFLGGNYSIQDATRAESESGTGYGYYLLYENRISRLDEDSSGFLLTRAADSRAPCPPALRAAVLREITGPTPDYRRATGLLTV